LTPGRCSIGSVAKDSSRVATTPPPGTFYRRASPHVMTRGGLSLVPTGRRRLAKNKDESTRRLTVGAIRQHERSGEHSKPARLFPIALGSHRCVLITTFWNSHVASSVYPLPMSIVPKSTPPASDCAT
jgi:hypothetical protein